MNMCAHKLTYRLSTVYKKLETQISSKCLFLKSFIWKVCPLLFMNPVNCESFD